MAKDQSQSDFVNFFRQNKEALKNLQNMKSAQVPGQPPDIAEGDYVAKVVGGSVVMRDFTISGAKKSVPIIKFRLVVNRGAYEGTTLNKDYILGKLGNSQMSEDEIYQRCAQDLMTLGADKNCFSSAEALAEEIAGIAAEKPLVRIKVKMNAKGYVNVYINGSVEEDSKSKAKAKDEDVEDEDEVDDEEVEDQDDDSDEEDEDDTVELQIGDRVRYQPKGGRKATWSIHGVDEATRTVSLRDVSGKVVKGVAWDVLEAAE